MNYTVRDKLYMWLGMAFETSPRSADELLGAYDNSVESLRDDVVGGGRLRDGVKLGAAQLKKLKSLASNTLIEEHIASLEKRGVYALTPACGAYPERLRSIYDPPLVLYCRGQRLDAERCRLPFAIIGTRNCTEYGERMAMLFGRELAAHGMTIVSGLAFGCDAYASMGALEAENSPLPTVAVLGHGVCVEKHDVTNDLMERIIDRGVVLSEMLPDSRPHRYSYPLRNRIISGMSDGVLVVEAGERSGTSITANAALEQGRQLFAIPGRLTDRMSAGTNKMLQMSMAQPVFGVEDVLDSFGLNSSDIKPIRDEAAEKKQIDALDENGKKLYELLLHGEKNIDALVELSGLSVNIINLYLTEMELSGLIKQLPGRLYTVN